MPDEWGEPTPEMARNSENADEILPTPDFRAFLLDLAQCFCNMPVIHPASAVAFVVAWCGTGPSKTE